MVLFVNRREAAANVCVHVNGPVEREKGVLRERRTHSGGRSLSRQGLGPVHSGGGPSKACGQLIFRNRRGGAKDEMKSDSGPEFHVL